MRMTRNESAVMELLQERDGKLVRRSDVVRWLIIRGQCRSVRSAGQRVRYAIRTLITRGQILTAPTIATNGRRRPAALITANTPAGHDAANAQARLVRDTVYEQAAKTVLELESPADKAIRKLTDNLVARVIG
jgi:hypothetical protein